MDQSRRDFVGVGLGFGLAALLGGSRLAQAALSDSRRAAGLAHFPIGVQLWSFDAEMKKDVRAALAAVRRIGYRQVETASLHGLSRRCLSPGAG